MYRIEGNFCKVLIFVYLYELSVYENKKYENLNIRKFCVNLDSTPRVTQYRHGFILHLTASYAANF